MNRVNRKWFTAAYFVIGTPIAILLKNHYDPFIAIGFLFLWAFTMFGIEAGVNA